MGDIERILGRLALRSARPRDLEKLGNALAVLPTLQTCLSPIECSPLKKLATEFGEFPAVTDLLSRAIKENPPMVVRDGGVLADGYDGELDELRGFSSKAGNYLIEMETRERERTGLATLKVGYNRVHGYYIEISRGQSESAPPEYIRRQTLKNVERYITPELKEFEDKALSASARALAREKQLYDELIERLNEELYALQKASDALCELDVLANFAERAMTLDYCRPSLHERTGVEIRAGRHPVVAQIHPTAFVPNDVSLHEERSTLIITGPNMGGKSTYMRQTALIVLLAHVGSYVPAETANIGLVDQIFTRIGSSDDLAGGRSTFMVEMTETANILHNATSRSLVLMDEIGRGTSTFDGLSLALASATWLAKETQALTLFATHYFELTQLPESIDTVFNVHLDATEHNDSIVFLHAVQEGPASQSYGIHVAKLAGIPHPVLEHAQMELQRLEKLAPNALVETPSLEEHLDSKKRPQQDLFAEIHPAVQLLSEIDPDNLTPLQALEFLFELKQKSQ